MKVYVAMICDRHANAELEVFTTAEAAVDYARTWAHGHALEPGDIEEHTYPGWLYYAGYSPESDCVWVVEKRIDAEVPVRCARCGTDTADEPDGMSVCPDCDKAVKEQLATEEAPTP